MVIRKAYIVPGQPHMLLAPEKNSGWVSLRKTYEEPDEVIAAC